MVCICRIFLLVLALVSSSPAFPFIRMFPVSCILHERPLQEILHSICTLRATWVATNRIFEFDLYNLTEPTMPQRLFHKLFLIVIFLLLETKYAVSHVENWVSEQSVGEYKKRTVLTSLVVQWLGDATVMRSPWLKPESSPYRHN